MRPGWQNVLHVAKKGEFGVAAIDHYPSEDWHEVELPVVVKRQVGGGPLIEPLPYKPESDHWRFA